MIRALIAILGLLYIVDVVTTVIGVGYLGAIELNPLMRNFATSDNPAVFLSGIKAISLTGVALISWWINKLGYREGAIRTLFFVVGAQFTVGAVNILSLQYLLR